ncbi:DUF2726 domain-containing protein [Aestuariibacter salexigens]|uniref:DUF2726 domain-containing protein n=1 Tax=Aestuariibacter salexigens TaxID=226010 RepID=UPI0004005323|nr:DUF2726 domain-containing protein [Aestuariibacter salexigens]
MELAIILMMLLIVVAIGAIKLSDQGLSFPFKRRTQLLTPVERSFLELLERAVGNKFRIMCRVRLTDIISLRQSTNKKQGKVALSRANGKHLDFVLCSRTDMSPIVAIDLVHNAGKEGYKTNRDWFISGTLDAAKIPHVRIKVKSGYTVEDIRGVIDAKLAPLRRVDTSLPALDAPTPKMNDKKRPTRPIRSSRPVAA